jgi:hypothetical protein
MCICLQLENQRLEALLEGLGAREIIRPGAGTAPGGSSVAPVSGTAALQVTTL